MKILLTGGLGYIGSHTAVALIDAGYQPIIIDNLSNSKLGVLARIQDLTGLTVPFYQLDLADRVALHKVFLEEDIAGVIHFAAFRSVPESVENPILYLDNNVLTLLNLVSVMSDFDCTKIVFSSSCTVYGSSNSSPLSEDMARSHESPYGLTKIIGEDILTTLEDTKSWNVGILRYFNPVGAHSSGMLGEDPVCPPRNLFPHLSAAAMGEGRGLVVYGGDYPTEDGTGIRDYIHVEDLAAAHVKSLFEISKGNSHILNIGTGKGYSVLDVIATYEKVSGHKIPYIVKPRREGDVCTAYADPSKAEAILGWHSKEDLESMCQSDWLWMSSIKR
jgi:UDP-glucose 4-epimerase